MNLLTLTCNECDEVIFSVKAFSAIAPTVEVNAEVFAICGACGHTGRYVWIEEDGTPAWRGSS